MSFPVPLAFANYEKRDHQPVSLCVNRLALELRRRLEALSGWEVGAWQRFSSV